jgi:UPF0755 protein
MVVVRKLARVLLIFALGVVLVAWAMSARSGAFTSPVLVGIPAGSSSWQIGQRLESAGVIRSAVLFEFWRGLHRDSTLHAGVYRFERPASVTEALDRLRRGEVFAYTVTIPEGYSRYDIARTLSQMRIVPAADFLAATLDTGLIRDLDPQATSLDGYLFPDTYRIAPGTTPSAIVAMMVRRFRQELARTGAAQGTIALNFTGNHGAARSDPSVSIHEWVTIASMVEKESALNSERPLIAGVFYNRLSRGLPLQCDPTVIYAAEVQGVYTGKLTRADLQLASPYNTYAHSGLPPGPIANPGLNALEAASHPRETDYLYFVSNGRGAHRFARTLAEHDANVAAWVREERARNR